jgi:hypothetical protein
MSGIPVFVESEFRKASASNASGECVRVARRDGWVVLRDDKKTFRAPDDQHLVVASDGLTTSSPGFDSALPVDCSLNY